MPTPNSRDGPSIFSMGGQPLQYQNVGLERIDFSDETFRITTEEGIGPLARSIHDIGVVTPPLLLSTGDRFTIVSGFRRLAACRQGAVGSVQGRILHPEADRFACAQMAVAENAWQRTLNPVEMSRAYRLLAKHLPEGGRLESAVESVGLPAGPELIRKVWSLCRLADPIQQGILEEKISLPMAVELGLLDEKAGSALALLFLSVPMSLTRQREVLGLLHEIARRETIDPSQVLEGADFRRFLENMDTDPGQRAGQIRNYLKQRRFPELSKVEGDFAAALQRMHLEPSIRFSPPPNFEGGRFSVEFGFKNMEGFSKQVRALNRLIGNPDLEKILEKF